MQTIQAGRYTAAWLVLALTALTTLGACSPSSDTQTVGEKVDATIEKADDKMEAAKNEMQQGAAQAGQAASDAMTSAAQTTGDAVQATLEAASDTAITVAIKGSLAADDDLKVLDISVSTDQGRAVLSGTAPDARARDRAGQMAIAVSGVVSVDNQLVVTAK